MDLQDIQHLLDQINGCTFASMDCITKIDLRGGRSNPFKDRVTKHTVNNRVMLFTNQKSNGYENMVRRRLEQEGKNPDTFSLGELAWGTRLPNSPIIEHKGQYYLQCIFLRPGESQHYLDEEPIAKDDIQGYPEEGTSNRQGLEDQVVVRTFKLESIKAIRLMNRLVAEYPEVVKVQVNA